jgi:exopolyphosphatase/pppGpp-phosphohydrolase
VGSLRRVRVAAFDLGSNSFHLIVAEVRAEGSFEPIITEKEMLRLGDLVGRHGRIPDEAADAAVAVVRRFRQLADAAGADEVVACGRVRCGGPRTAARSSTGSRPRPGSASR